MTVKDAALTAAVAVAIVTGAVFGTTQMGATTGMQAGSAPVRPRSLPLSIATMGRV